MARVYGLTGGIASGKSTVARMLRDLGAPVVDADELARRVVAPGTEGLAAVVERFGRDVLDDRGHLDRKKLGDRVFADDDARRDLEHITHPRIAALSQSEIARHAEDGAPVVVYEAALIVENGLHEGMDGLIVVSVPRPVQLERLVARDGLAEDEARARLRAQLPLSRKVEVADHVIDNAGDLEETRAQVQRVWSRIREQTEAR